MLSSSKATLSTALAKARTAVQLDQAQCYDGARRYYAEAVTLIERVVGRVSNEEDRQKLEDIRQNYTDRIRQLDAVIVNPVTLLITYSETPTHIASGK